jgi:tetratricopeptide (TPR) repeat protein
VTLIVRRSFRAAVVNALLAAGVASVARAEPASPSAIADKIAKATAEVTFINLEKANVLYAEARAMAERGSLDWQKATLGEATCIWHQLPIERANAEKAAVLFDELVDTAPRGPFAGRALMNLGRILELPDDRDDPVDLPGARAFYQRVADGWPADPIAGEATLRVAGTYIQTFDKPSVLKGVELLRHWVETHPSDALASIMWQYLAETYFFPLEDYRRSLEAYDKVDALGWTENGIQGRTYWRIAQMSEKFLKDRDAAIRYYTKIIVEAPTTGKAFESQLALKRLGAPLPAAAAPPSDVEAPEPERDTP